jgi:hypothetical protein
VFAITPTAMQETNNTIFIHELYRAAFDNVKHYIYQQIEEMIEEYEAQPVLTIILNIAVNILLPTLYIYTVANELDKWKSATLLLLGMIYGLFKIGMLSLKFFRSLLDLVVEWRKQKVRIEGIHYIYAIVFLCLVLLILSVILIYISFTK